MSKADLMNHLPTVCLALMSMVHSGEKVQNLVNLCRT